MSPGKRPDMRWLDPALLTPGHDLEWLATRIADGLRGGRHLAARRGRGVEFAQHRSYDRGDDIRLIDWKAFGRTERLVIREAEIEADHRFWLIIDASPSMAQASPETGHRKLDVARALAAALAAVAERQGDDYGLAVPGHPLGVVLPPGRGRSWFSRLLGRAAALASDQAFDSTAAEKLALALRATQWSSDAVVLTDGYEQGSELVDLGRELSASGVATRVLCLETRFERDWPLAGDVACVDLETGREVVTGPAASAGYRTRREETLNQLRDRLLGFGVPMDRFCIDDPWDRQLRDWLESS